MALTNTPQRYGGVTKTFHWLTALLILTLLPLGWWANQMPYDTSEQLADKAWMFSLHKTMGVTAFFVAVGRIIWALGQPKPGLLNADHRVESFVAETIHWMLYASLVIVPLSGWIGHAAASGFAPIWWPFGQGLPLVPKDTGIEHFMSSVHWVATKVLIASLLLHIAGALKHHVIDRDATLRRMLPGEPVIGVIPDQRHSRAPVLGAGALWALAIGVAAVFASGDNDGAVAADLAEVSSEWQVQEGSIAITVTQFGSEVSGGFEDWTAEITFDETIQTGQVGTVTAVISIPSLSLGSVTDQAMGADFLDANSFSTATFTADLQHAADDFEAVGTLTIKDTAVPLTLPFALTLDGDTAQMDARLTLNRLDFGVGANMPDESSLAFAVPVVISLTAVRGGAAPASE